MMSASNANPAEKAGGSGLEAAQSSDERTGAGRPTQLVGGAWLYLVAGLAAGALAWAILLHFDQPFKMPQVQGMNSSPEELAQSRRAEFGNIAFVFAVFGALIGAAFAAAEGLARKRPGFIALGLLLGATLGGGFGAMGGAMVKIVFEYPVPESMHGLMRDPNFPFDMIKTMLMHAIGWGITGLGIGLGLGLTTWRAKVIVQAPFAAVVGGAISALVYGFVVALLVKTAQTDLMVPHPGWNRLGWFLMTAGLMGLVVGGLGKSRRPKAGASGSGA